MQYILTQEEIDKIHYDHEAVITELNSTIQELCIEVACNSPVNEVDRDRYNRQGSLKPWGCILVDRNVGYCDLCPVRKVCPNKKKSYSK